MARRWRPAPPSSRCAPGPTGSPSSAPMPCATPRSAGSTNAARSPAISSRTPGTRRNARERGRLHPPRRTARARRPPRRHGARAGRARRAAMTIERVVSPLGIEAWLVRDHTLPMIAVEFAFLGSAEQDPADKPGVANMATSLLDEGAGPYDATAFHDRLERKAIEMSFRTGRDYWRGAMRTLKDNRDEAFDYLRLALSEPRFDPAAVERERAQIMSRLRREALSPNDMANRSWWATAFPGHPYGQPVNGTLESLPNITVDDLKSYTRRVLARDNVKIAVVGDIDAETTGALLDRTFGALPAKAELTPVAAVVPQGLGRRDVIHLDVPQAVVHFGGPGLARSDPDFMAA